MNKFESWLANQSNATTSIGYSTSCNGASTLPLPQETFHSCVGSYQQEELDDNIMIRDGRVRIVTLPFRSRVRYDSHYEDLGREWIALEAFFEIQRNYEAPPGVRIMYHSSKSFWIYDTTSNMLTTAYSTAAIALAVAALVVLFSTRSFALTIFSLITIGFVLTSTTAVFVAVGWTLGFLESICFATLIGISCDFVLHFGHAYANIPSGGNRHERTQHSLVAMGPSILAAAFTTIFTAVIMFFTVIRFFQKFGFILECFMLNATIASFVMYNLLTDCLGPAQPTSVLDTCLMRLFACCRSERKSPHGMDSVHGVADPDESIGGTDLESAIYEA